MLMQTSEYIRCLAQSVWNGGKEYKIQAGPGYFQEHTVDLGSRKL